MYFTDTPFSTTTCCPLPSRTAAQLWSGGRKFADRNMIYESADYHNAVFVGYDGNGIPRHAHKRGTGQTSSYRGNADSCMPEYSFHWHGQSEKLYLFEAPIDMLSFISMHKENWRDHSYAAACCISSRVMYQMMKDNPNIQKVYLCLRQRDVFFNHRHQGRPLPKLRRRGKGLLRLQCSSN